VQAGSPREAVCILKYFMILQHVEGRSCRDNFSSHLRFLLIIKALLISWVASIWVQLNTIATIINILQWEGRCFSLNPAALFSRSVPSSQHSYYTNAIQPSTNQKCSAYGTMDQFATLLLGGFGVITWFLDVLPGTFSCLGADQVDIRLFGASNVFSVPSQKHSI